MNPAALEFLERDAIMALENQLDKKFPNSNAEAQLLIEIDGNYEELLNKEIEIISEVSEKYGAIDIILAEERQKMEDIWAFRRSIGEAVKSISVYKEEDTVVPRYKLPVLLSGVNNISSKYLSENKVQLLQLQLKQSLAR